jgi:import inner membrane translocase subunit TIM22
LSFIYLKGFGLGAAFGLFMSSFEYAGPSVSDEMVKQTTRQQMKSALKDMGTRSYSMAKNFAVVGAIYSGTECCIESVSVYIYDYSIVAGS